MAPSPSHSHSNSPSRILTLFQTYRVAHSPLLSAFGPIGFEYHDNNIGYGNGDAITDEKEDRAIRVRQTRKSRNAVINIGVPFKNDVYVVEVYIQHAEDEDEHWKVCGAYCPHPVLHQTTQSQLEMFAGKSTMISLWLALESVIKALFQSIQFDEFAIFVRRPYETLPIATSFLRNFLQIRSPPTSNLAVKALSQVLTMHELTNCQPSSFLLKPNSKTDLITESAALTTNYVKQLHKEILGGIDIRLSLLAAAYQSSRSTSLIHPIPLPFILTTEAEGVTRKLRGSLIPVHRLPPIVSPTLLRLQDIFSSLPPLRLLTNAENDIEDISYDSRLLLASLLSSPLRFRMDFSTPQKHPLLSDFLKRHNFLPQSIITSLLPTYIVDINGGSDENDPYWREAVQKCGESICFHGSPTENWHSIIGQGLESKENAKEQTSGALFGTGIYMSDDLRVARMFTRTSKCWSKSNFGEHLDVVGIYSVVNDPDGVQMQMKSSNSKSKSDKLYRQLNKEKNNNQQEIPEAYYVIKDSTYIRLRGLCVWKVQKVHFNKSPTFWVLLVYGLILLGIILSQVLTSKWKRALYF